MTIKVWDTESRHCVRTLTGHTADVLALSASQNFLYSSSVDCTVKVRTRHSNVVLTRRRQVWDRRRLVCVQTLGDSALPRTVAVRAGKSFVAAAKGQMVQVWENVIQTVPAAAAVRTLASDVFRLHDLVCLQPITPLGSPLMEALNNFVAIKTVRWFIEFEQRADSRIGERRGCA